MNNFMTFLMLCISCIIFQKSYGRRLYNYKPYQSFSQSSDESKFGETKLLNAYPQSSASIGNPAAAHLFKINRDESENSQKKLPNKRFATESDSSDYKTLETQVGEHLVRVKSKKENLASHVGDESISINPKYSHIIEIIHRKNNVEKQKPAQIYSDTVEKQSSELTIPELEQTGKSEENGNPVESNFNNEEFRESEENTEEPPGFDEDPTELDEADESDSEEHEGEPDEFNESGEEDTEEFEVGKGYEDFEGDQEEIDEYEEYPDESEVIGDSGKFSESDEKGSEDTEGNEEEFDEYEEYPEELGDSAELSEYDESGGDSDAVSDEMNSEDFETDEEISTEIKDPEEILPHGTEETEFSEETKIQSQTGTEQISSNKESSFNEEFEGSGELLSDINDRNTTKAGRILGMFSRQNETFPICTTPKGEAGHCRRLGECLLSEALNNFNGFLQQLCLIRGALVGICCPDNPVIETVNPDENITTQLTSEEITQPPEGCGLNTKTRIVGGTISVPHEWTWMVALMRRNRFYCGGVIINNWYILTAAHCVMGMNVKDLTVRLGEYDFNEASKHTEDLSVAEIKRHAQFVTLTFQHDIALLKLKRSIKYSKYVGSICLPEQKARDYSDVKGTVVGWGTVSFGGAASPVLRQVTVPVWKNEDCDRTYLLERIGDAFMCAGSPEKGEDACQGDSGGPLMTLNENSRWEVIGLVSWGRRCGDPTYPGVYTRVTTYLDWIKQNAV